MSVKSYEEIICKQRHKYGYEKSEKSLKESDGYHERTYCYIKVDDTYNENFLRCNDYIL